MTLVEFWWCQADHLAQVDGAPSAKMTQDELDELERFFEENKVKYGRKR
jgi:hypothetical protein